MKSLPCRFDPPHTHTLPDDWQLGGPDGTDFRSDSRWRPSTYQYWSDRLQILHTSQAFACDDEAIDFFTAVASWGSGFNPTRIRARRPGSETFIVLPVIYDKKTDEVTDV